MTHASVSTLLKRLEEKGLVDRQKGSVGKAFVYGPRVQPAGTRRRLLHDLLDRMFGGSGVALVSSLLESRPPTPKELEELEVLLRELRQQQTRQTRGKAAKSGSTRKRSKRK
jgi:predicted transcriptional regulator